MNAQLAGGFRINGNYIGAGYFRFTLLCVMSLGGSRENVGSANHNRLKFLTPYCDMGLQQTPHLFKCTNIVHIEQLWGIFSAVLHHGVRLAIARLLLNTL